MEAFLSSQDWDVAQEPLPETPPRPDSAAQDIQQLLSTARKGLVQITTSEHKCNSASFADLQRQNNESSTAQSDRIADLALAALDTYARSRETTPASTPIHTPVGTPSKRKANSAQGSSRKKRSAPTSAASSGRKNRTGNKDERKPSSAASSGRKNRTGNEEERKPSAARKLIPPMYPSSKKNAPPSGPTAGPKAAMPKKQGAQHKKTPQSANKKKGTPAEESPKSKTVIAIGNNGNFCKGDPRLAAREDFELEKVFTPAEVPGVRALCVVQIGTTIMSVTVLTEDGRVYSWGRPQKGV